MDFNKARTFVAVVDAGSFTSAAHRLLRTQQAISLQLQLLEEELEVSLFDRHGPKITLTEDGEKLYQLFKPHLVEIESGVLGLKASKKQARGVIRIGAWMEQAVSYLPEMMSKFKTEYPQVDYHIVIGDDLEIEQLLRENQIDIGIQVICQDKKLFKCDPVYRQPLLPVISRRFLTANPHPKTIADTLNLPLIDYIDEYSAYNQWIKKNDREHLPQARKKTRVVTTSNNVVMKQLVLEGLGFGFLHQESIQTELELGELMPLLVESKAQNIHVELDLVHKRKHALGYVHLQFIAFLREHRDSWMAGV